MGRTTDVRGSVKKYSAYACLLLIVVLPYVKNYGHYLIGGDLGILEDAIDVNVERSLYLWSDNDGSGGLIIGRFPNIIYFFTLQLLLTFFSQSQVQLISLALYLSLGFWSVYHLVKKLGQKFEFGTDAMVASVVSFFYFTNLLSHAFLYSGFYMYVAYISVTPALIYAAWKWIEGRKGTYLLFFLLSTILNFPIFGNVTLAIIQYITIFAFLLLFTRRDYKGIVSIGLLFSLLNMAAIVEYVLFYVHSKDLVMSSSLNQYLVEMSSSVQASAFSLDKVLSFVSGNLFGRWWNYQGLVDNFPYNDLYRGVFYGVILWMPLIIIVISFVKGDFGGQRRISLYLLSLFLVFLIPLSQVGFRPLAGLLKDLLAYIPALGIFRNSLKFVVPVILAASCLLYIALAHSKFLRYIFILYLIALNVYSFAGYYFNRHSFGVVDDKYRNMDVVLNEAGIDDHSKCMIYPASEFILFGFKWNYVGYSPFLLAQNKMSCFHKNAETVSAANKHVYGRFSDLEQVKEADWRKYNIKYVILHNDVNYKVFDQPNYSSKIRSYLQTHFRLVLSNKKFSLYETYDERISPLSARNLSFEKVNPVKYRLHIKNLDRLQDMAFLKSFHKEWKLYLDKGAGEGSCTKAGEYDVDSYGLTFYDNVQGEKAGECAHEKTFFEGEELSYLWREPIFDSSHRVINEYANVWVIDPEYVRANYPQEYYSQNADGSMDIELTLYFRPQSYLYMGMIISALTLIGCIGYLTVAWWRRRKAQSAAESA